MALQLYENRLVRDVEKELTFDLCWTRSFRSCAHQDYFFFLKKKGGKKMKKEKKKKGGRRNCPWYLVQGKAVVLGVTRKISPAHTITLN